LKVLIIILLLSLLSIVLPSNAQEIERSEIGIIYKRERSLNLDLNTDGWGFGYRIGFFKTGYVKRSLDINFSFIRDPKEVKVYNSGYATSKSYVYGKERKMYSLKVLYGKQKDISNKPYWGGVDIRWLNLFGFNLAIGKPIYLYVDDQTNDGVISLERYDKVKHDPYNIVGRGPYVNGLDELEIFPGITFKTAINVEYGSSPEKTKAIEAGVMFNGYIYPYNIMAYSEPSYFDVVFYVSFQFGKRYNN